MTGKPAASPSRLKHPVALTAITLVLVSAAIAGAWLTQPPAEAPPPRVGKKNRQAPVQVATPVPAPSPAPALAPAASIAAAAATTPAVAEPAPPPAAPPATPSAAGTPRDPAKPLEWSSVPVAELRAKAEANEIPAMEELARRLVQGIGITKDQQAGAGWLLRAAQAGSPQSAFNVGVMYERGFVVERDSTRAIEWYRKAVSANLAMAKHNLALLLRDGKGTARNGKEAVELLRSATRQGMAASMFTLGDIYERGDAAPKDPAMALAWFAMTAEFERQMNKGAETPLAKTAVQRSQALQRVLTPAELEKAQQFGQAEFKEIVAALQPPKPPPAPEPESAPAPPPPAEAAAPAASEAEPEWPKTQLEQVRAIQQALLDLKLLRDKPDGALGPMTRNAIRSFQKGASMRETGEPSRDVYLAMLAAAKRDTVANSPLPPPRAEPKPDPAKAEAEKAEAARAEAAKAEAAKAQAAKAEAARAEAAKAEAAKAEAARAEAAKAEAARVEAAKAEAAKVEAERAKAVAAKAEVAKAEAAKAAVAKVDPPKPAMPRIETEKPVAAQIAARPEPPAVAAASPPLPKPIDIGSPEAPPPPPTSTDIARAVPKPEPPKVDPEAWPAATADQVKIVQIFLRELHFYRDTPDGRLGPATRAAIQDYQRAMGLKISGEPNREVFESLKEMRAITKPKAATSN